MQFLYDQIKNSLGVNARHILQLMLLAVSHPSAFKKWAAVEVAKTSAGYTHIHHFDDDGVYLGTDNNVNELTTTEGNSILSYIAEHPYPIKLEEGVIVQDTDQVPFEGKWRPAKEAKGLKAKREAARAEAEAEAKSEG